MSVGTGNNLASWRRTALPGLERDSLRLGEEVTLNLAGDATDASASGPEPFRLELALAAGTARFGPPRPGLYRIDSGGASHRLAVNALDPTESDLGPRASGR